MRLGRGTYDMNGLYWWSSWLAVCFDDAQRHARLCGTETGAEVERWTARAGEERKRKRKGRPVAWTHCHQMWKRESGLRLCHAKLNAPRRRKEREKEGGGHDDGNR